MHGHVHSWHLAAAAWLLSLGCRNVSAEHMATGNFGDQDHEDGSMAFFKAASQHRVREAFDGEEKLAYDYDSTEHKRTPSDEAHKRRVDGSGDARRTAIQATDLDQDQDVLPFENTPLPVGKAGFSASIAQQNQSAKENESNEKQQQHLQQDLVNWEHEKHEEDGKSDQNEQHEQNKNQRQQQNQQQKQTLQKEQKDQRLAVQKEHDRHDNITQGGVKPAKSNVLGDKLKENTDENAKEKAHIGADTEKGAKMVAVGRAEHAVKAEERSITATNSLPSEHVVHEHDRDANESLKEVTTARQEQVGLSEEARSVQESSVGVVSGETRGATVTRRGPVEQGRPRQVPGSLGEQIADSGNEQRRHALRSQDYGAGVDYSYSHMDSAHEMQDTPSSVSNPVYPERSQVRHEVSEHAEMAGIDEARLSTDFKEADANANGALEEPEIESLLSRVGAPMDIKWRDFDHDHDGKLTFVELRNLVVQEGDRIVDEDAVKDGFYRADADRTGFLEASEVSALMKDVGAPPSLRWELFDEDHDGRLSFGELLQLARETEIEEGEHGDGGYSQASFDEDRSEELQDNQGENIAEDEELQRRMHDEEMMHYIGDGGEQDEPVADAIRIGGYGA